LNPFRGVCSVREGRCSCNENFNLTILEKIKSNNSNQETKQRSSSKSLKPGLLEVFISQFQNKLPQTESLLSFKALTEHKYHVRDQLFQDLKLLSEDPEMVCL